jgi:hypothetical protein
VLGAGLAQETDECEIELGIGEKGLESHLECIEPRAVVHAEDHAQNRVQGDLLHRLVHVDMRAWRPTRGVSQRQIANRISILRDAPTVERRQEEAPLGQVPLLLEQEERVLAEEGPEYAVPLAGVKMGDVRGEDAPDRRGVAEENEPTVGAEVQCECVTAFFGAAFEKCEGSGHPLQRLLDGRPLR